MLDKVNLIFAVLIPNLKSILFVSLLGSNLKGNTLGFELSVIVKGKVILSGSALAYADGEFVSDLPLEVSNVPKALTTWLAS